MLDVLEDELVPVGRAAMTTTSATETTDEEDDEG